MSDRESRLLDAAIDVLGTGGMRRLTHRAVDARAALPVGSASNRFRTRDALLSAVLRRILEREGEIWTRAAIDVRSSSIDAVASAFGQVVAELSAKDRVLTLARHAVFIEAGHQATLRVELARAQQELVSWIVPLLADLGSADPAQHTRHLLALIDGLLAGQLANPGPGFNPTTPIGALLRGLTSTEVVTAAGQTGP